jgi:hypothetical protein
MRIGEITNIAKSKMLTHFLKGKISLILLETITIVLGELEYLEGLVKLAKKLKDEELNKSPTLLQFLLYPP